MSAFAVNNYYSIDVSAKSTTYGNIIGHDKVQPFLL